jgi:glycosyltransferase involved in cell wall biosynthesis
MKLIIIGPGYSPIPPIGWGAVESLIWDYYEKLLSIDVNAHIINNKDLNQVITECNHSNADVIHIMYDDYCIIAPHLTCKKILYTSHYAYITHPSFKEEYSHYFHTIFMRVIEYQQYITSIYCISPHIKDVYRKYGYQGDIQIIHNGAREDKFVYASQPLYPDKSIYIAKIEYRKGQYTYQSISSIDFVGNYHDSPFNQSLSNYLGEWSKTTLYNNLTNYGNLILLSKGEADPLVVKEGLMAGLGVVISECSSANLDLTLPFITVIPNDKLEDITYVEEKIKENRLVSISMRDKIREYALLHFSWENIIQQYILNINL